MPDQPAPLIPNRFAQLLPEVPNPKEAVPAKPVRNYAAGIAQPATVRAAMLQGFRHGKARGETTHWPEWDQHFTWKPGEVNGWTGYNNSGKTEALLQLMLTKSVRDGWKWAIWCPENDPVDEIYDSLAHALAGQSPDPDWRNQMSEATYENCMTFLFAHFFVIDPPEAPTLECLFDYTAYVVELHQCRGVLWDPWNRIAHAKAGRRDDEYLQDVLPAVVAFAKKHQQCFNMTMHPTKPVKSLPKPGVEPTWNCPDQFDLAGGAMWGNMLHNVMAVHRPFYLQNKANTAVEWHSHKIKKQKLVGRPGFVTLDFDFGRNRYMLNGSTPLEPYASRIVSPESFQQPTAPARSPLPIERFNTTAGLPASNFEAAPWEAPAPLRIAATARPDSPLGVASVRYGPASIE